MGEPNLSDAIHMTTTAGLTAASNTVKLKQYLSQTVAALQVIDDSRHDIKEIIDIAAEELEIDKKIFRKAATFIHKNKTTSEKEVVLESVQEMIDKVSTIS